jgi:hypothetical protein
MRRPTAQALLGLFAGGAACGAAHAERPQIGAFFDIQQVVQSQLSGQGVDDLTYTEVSGTLAAQITNRRVTVSGTYRLAYRIPEMGDTQQSFVQDGVMQAQAVVVEEWLTVQGGGIVTRSRIDPSGPAPPTNFGSGRNLTQTYSGYIQPMLAHRIGDLGFSANYRYGYTKNKSDGGAFSTGPVTDRFDSSVSQQAQLSLGMERSALPFDWKLSGEVRAEDLSNLDQQLRALNIIGEIKLPVARTIALVTSAGYEKTRTTEREALIDSLTGLPVIGRGGSFVSDVSKPRVLTYDVNGFIADGGVIWRPSRRSRFEARAGYRYGGFSVTGLVEMKPSEKTGLTLIVSDQIQSFGQGLTSGLASSPVNLDLGQAIDPTSSFQNCLFGKAAGSGRCIGGSLGQASANMYRERGASIIFTRALRQWNVSAGLGYTRRNYIDDPNAVVSLAGVVDQSIFGNFAVGGQLTRQSGVSFSFTGNMFKNGQVGASDVLSGSASANYFRTFGRGIQMQASVAVDASKQDGLTADVSGRAQVGLQYRF